MTTSNTVQLQVQSPRARTVNIIRWKKKKNSFKANVFRVLALNTADKSYYLCIWVADCPNLPFHYSAFLSIIPCRCLSDSDSFKRDLQQQGLARYLVPFRANVANMTPCALLKICEISWHLTFKIGLHCQFCFLRSLDIFRVHKAWGLIWYGNSIFIFSHAWRLLYLRLASRIVK